MMLSCENAGLKTNALRKALRDWSILEDIATHLTSFAEKARSEKLFSAVC